METIIVASQDPAFRALYEALASELGAGRVYVEHQVVPPNARMGIPQPDHAIVLIDAPDEVRQIEGFIETWRANDSSRVAVVLDGADTRARSWLSNANPRALPPERTGLDDDANRA